MNEPGRSMPARYRYAPAALAGGAELDARTLYVIGGLYGNPLALDEIERMAALEADPVTLIFNGDFHWFDVDPVGFEQIDARIAAHAAIQGNVEAELIADDAQTGCGCAYPDSVNPTFVQRSNAIHARLRQTARDFPSIRARLAQMPLHLRARVGDLRIGIVHGDAESLAGWRFAESALDERAADAWLAAAFRDAAVDLFASSHTCLPVFRTFGLDRRVRGVINNGAAGLPNFAGSRHGLITRIALTPPAEASVYGLSIAGTRIDAMPVRYDAARWAEVFLANWPAGSTAHESYWARIERGTDYYFSRAIPRYRELPPA